MSEGKRDRAKVGREEPEQDIRDLPVGDGPTRKVKVKVLLGGIPTVVVRSLKG